MYIIYFKGIFLDGKLKHPALAYAFFAQIGIKMNA
jgi:hypothetical protein